MKASFVPPALFLIAVSLLAALATQEPPPAVEVPFRPTPDFPNLDAAPAPSPAAADAVPGSQPVSGPIAPAGGQPAGALSGRADLARRLIEHRAIRLAGGLLAGEVLPPAHDHIHVLRIEFDQPRDAT